MTDTQKKSQEARLRNQERRAKYDEERTKAIQLVRFALQRILESEDATPKEILRSAELLAELAHPRCL